MSWTVWIGALAASLITVAAAAAAFVPGPHRMICPTCFGLQKAGPGLYTDAPPERQTELREMLETADRETARFFGELISSPRVVACASQKCVEAFSRGYVASGVTFGSYAIRIAPRGIHQKVITHERMHAELHRRVGDIRMARGAIPTWFDEGLAVLVAGDDRFLRRRNPAAEADIADARGQSDWARLVDRHGWRAMYGAATQRVVAYERRIGRDGLRRVVERVAAGEDFDAALNLEVVRSRPD